MLLCEVRYLEWLATITVEYWVVDPAPELPASCEVAKVAHAGPEHTLFGDAIFFICEEVSQSYRVDDLELGCICG